MKISKEYFNIERHTKKAVLVKLHEDHKNAVWFPKFRVDLDEDAKTIACTEKLWLEKEAETNRDFAAEKQIERDTQKIRNQEMLDIGGVLHEGGKAVVTFARIEEASTDQHKTPFLYFPLSMCEKVGNAYAAPRWLIKAKMVEATYKWVSWNGDKKVDHLGGSYFTATLDPLVLDTEAFNVDWVDLMKEQGRQDG